MFFTDMFFTDNTGEVSLTAVLAEVTNPHQSPGTGWSKPALGLVALRPRWDRWGQESQKARPAVPTFLHFRGREALSSRVPRYLQKGYCPMAEGAPGEVSGPWEGGPWYLGKLGTSKPTSCLHL